MIIKYQNASSEQLDAVLADIKAKRCFYPWESKEERLHRFAHLDISERAILHELGKRYE